jgi:hypothetical protein
MTKRFILFVLGFFVGYLLDLIPSVFEVVAKTSLCIESCPSLLRGTSLAIYAVMPLAWGSLFAAWVGKPNGKRILLTGLLFSLALMGLVTWFLYKHQHP